MARTRTDEVITMHHAHNDIVQESYQQLKSIFDNSEQAMYLYLDDAHKICNERFAKLLGYDSPEAWAAVKDPFPEVFVDEESQMTLIGAFQDAMEKLVGSTNDVTWKTKDGKPVATKVILVPYEHKGHFLALHFVA
jgi:PAS domain S-box-containing protein